jgi:tripartite ATP-independent transporter DctM subunit
MKPAHPVVQWAHRCDQWLVRGESALLIAAMFCSMGAATLSVVARQLGVAGTPWFDLLPRYATLAIAFLGAGLATREGGHIALNLLEKALPEHVARWTRMTGEGVACIVSILLARASWDFVLLERAGGSRVLDLLPSWIPPSILIWGFAIAAVRFWLRLATTHLPVSLAAPVVAALLPYSGEVAVWAAPLALAAGALAGMPRCAGMGGIALYFFWAAGASLAVGPVEIYRLAEAPALVTLPLFTFMGALLAKGQAPARLVEAARRCLCSVPGGLAIATVVLCAFFTTFTGASGVTILALGLLLHQLLTANGYSDRLSVGLITSSGSIGLMFQPALPLILYGVVAKVEIDLMFNAGILPGVLLIAAVSATALLLARGAAGHQVACSWRERGRALRCGAWELCLPVVILGAMRSGIASVSEGAALGALYVLVVALVVKKDVTVAQARAACVESGTMIGAVLVILGVALALTYLLVDYEVPQMIVGWAKAHIHTRWAFLLALNGLLLVVGCLLDIFSALLIFVPLVLPVALHFGVDPVHLGIVFLANLEIGYLTPPVGMNLFLSAFRFQRQLPAIWKTVWPFLVALIVALALITYIPGLSLWLVR